MPSIDRGIDALTEKIGHYAALLNVPLIAVIVYEVVMRYLFNAPTLWAFEVTNFLFGVNFMLGFAYAHKYGGHVAVDVFEARLSPGPRTKLRILTNALFFLPTTTIFAVGSVIYAASSWADWEKNSTSWAPALYPYKTLMALGFVALLLQGVSKLVADLRLLRSHGATAEDVTPPARVAGGIR
jgi:TRAP-type mannitol/chloroaromatic compound transport system permease small subunit